MQRIKSMARAYEILRSGGLLAYPTEAVYGLGCDPFNQQAIEKLLHLKQREPTKGLIVVVANWSQVYPLISSVSEKALQKVALTWPGHVTWVFPKSSSVLDIVSGYTDTVAIRMSAHPIVQALCAKGPVVSTSANIHGQQPARDEASLQLQFPKGIDGLVLGTLGHATKPSAIFDALSGKQWR